MYRLLAATVLGLTTSAGLHAAPTCEQFKASILEGAAQYEVPRPEFHQEEINFTDPEVTYWTITTFDDVLSIMICGHGNVSAFAVDANDNSIMSTTHLLSVMGIGLHGYGMEWRSALSLRDELVRAAKTSDRLIANARIQDGGDASFIVSIAGVPSFEINSDR
jgi:hypothetical protein